MSQESLIAELLEENEILREKLKEEILGKTEIGSLSCFKVEELDDKLKISGILLAPGIWNGVLYSVEEIKKMYDKFKDQLSKLPIKVEHEKDPKYGSRTVGQHTRVAWDDVLNAIVYEGVITDPEAIRDIKRGKFGATSLKSQMIKVLQGGIEKGVDIVPIDNSLTEAPACTPCRITFFQELSEGSEGIEYFGIFDINEMQTLKREKREELGEMTGQKNVETFKVEEDSVLVLPEEGIELSEDAEELELEIMPLTQALKEKRIIYKYLPPGEYPVAVRRVRRRRGYYYYPYYGYPYYGYPGYYEYPYPYYYGYPYPYYYGYYGYPERASEEEDWEVLAAFMIKKNKKTGKYVVFKQTGKTGFGAWKIVKQFDTLEEAKEYVKKQGGEITEEKAKKVKCPVCGKEFDTKEEMIEHFNKEHSDEYGKYGEGKYPEPKEEEESEMSEEELRRKRCPFCHELVEDLEKHFKKCPVYSETVENVLRCKFCGTVFNSRKDLIKHLTECEEFQKKYGRTESLSESKQENVGDLSPENSDEKSPTKEEVKEEVKEGVKEDEKVEEEPKKESKEEVKEEKEESPPSPEPTPEKSPSIEEIIEQVGTDLDIIAQLLIEREKREGKWD